MAALLRKPRCYNKAPLMQQSVQLLEQRIRELSAEIKEKERVLEILNETGALLNSKLALSAIVQAVTDAATESVGAQFGSFFYNTVNDLGESYTLYTLSGVPREHFSKFELPRATPLFGPTFRGEGVIRSGDITKHPLFGQWEPYRGMPPGHLPVCSYLAAPVVSRSGEVHGGLFFGHEEVDRFSAAHEAIVRGIASQAAIAIDNARLFEQLEQSRAQLQRLNDGLRLNVDERTAALRTSEQQFQQLVNGINDCAIYMLDPGGIVTTWNPGAERIKGYTSDEIVGKHFGLFYTQEDRQAGIPEQALNTALSKGKFETENWRVRKDGTKFWASILLDAIRNDAGDIIGFAKITRDMTERRAMQEQLQQSQKMEAIGQLTGGVAHDFNNLLTVILGNLDRVGRQLPNLDATLRSSLEQVTRAAQRAATLTSQLLAFSRRQPLNPKVTDVNRLLQGLSDLIRRTLGEHISVETVLSGGLWRIEIDANNLEMALLNLAVNARDAMPRGGKLTIETANAHLDEEYASRFIEISPGQYVCISISDTGSGMTQEVMARAFDPFYTTKPPGQGTGLGLSQVFGFVKQSGGHIRLYSEVGEGTTVRIYLPRSHASEAEEPVAYTAPHVVGRDTETVLVVEDDPAVRAYSTDCLRDLGFSVLEAPDGPTALRMLNAHQEIKLIFTDVGLPGMNGRELANEARRLRPSLPIMFTTGYARNAIVHQGRLDPGVELITKPFSAHQLGTRLRELLDSTVAVEPGKQLALVIDDEPLVRMLLGELLDELNFRVIQAATAREAQAAIERLPAVALAIIDVGLPDRSGLDIAKEFLKNHPEMKIIIATGFGQVSDPLITDNRAVLLAKPFNQDALLATLQRLGIRIRD
jgi:PAS domain S-box-containing protein